MDKDKQIEEMAFFIFENSPLTNLSSEDLAKDLYKEGYRKYIDGLIIIPKLSNEDIENIRKTLKNSAPCIIPIEKNQEWISVEDRLPEPNTNVLIYVFFHNQWQIVKGWLSYCDKKFHISNSDYPSLTDIPVTHWMPLPEPPETKGETK